VAALRALAYFVAEACTSFVRSPLVSALSVGTIAVSLFVLGAFLTVAAHLDQAVARWSRRVQVTFYLRAEATEAERQDLEARLRAEAGVGEVEYVSRAAATERFRALFPELASLPAELGESPFPASVEATLRPDRRTLAEVERLVESLRGAPGVEEVQYDRRWIERLAAVVRLVRGVALVLGGVLAVAGVFTISNVIRLALYARQDEIDIMRLVGATRPYLRGPFLVEGVLQGALGGGLALGLLWAGVRLFVADALAAAELLGPAVVRLPPTVSGLLVGGGALVGLLGSLVSLGRLRL
jgi:cell division transport system permease protein